MSRLTMGSLFDGIGGFPLAAIRSGITPVWASEIEAFPIAVTKLRFPSMTHVGDITKLNGAELPPVDIICGGSPCQDLSVAGARAGLAGARSGLFMEQMRIVREMRAADQKRGRFGVDITLSTLITIANSLEIHPALLLMDLPIELDLTGTNRYYANLLMTYSALPEEQRSQFRNMIQRLECSLDGDHLEQNDTGVN